MKYLREPQMMHSAFEAQQKHKYTLRNSNAAQRIDKLKTLKACIESYEEKIYAALQSDLRKSRFESALTELIFIYSEIGFAIHNLNSWMKPKRAGKTISNLFAKNRICYEPKGCCLIILMAISSIILISTGLKTCRKLTILVMKSIFILVIPALLNGPRKLKGFYLSITSKSGSKP